ncbi:MAG: hydantoinase B/oxoprolinase family protein [Proteobacteria bacterium]|nr:hydantoinase B/oxoprolinase family protein [Pseudomonadota bacterium]
MKPDPIRLEVYKNLLAEVAEEMGVTLGRTAYSPNIKERRDYSCAVFDGRGRLVAQALHIPVHLGSMPLSVAGVLESLELDPGDVALLNDPFRGGTHLPDLTMVAPVFGPDSNRPLFYTANRAHHADVGGMTPGSMPVACELYQEGLIIPPVRLLSGGRRVDGVWDLVLANVRTPYEREGDLSAQLAALEVGRRRLTAIASERGAEEVVRVMAELMDYAERIMRAAIREIPDGRYEFEDALDDDGVEAGPVPIRAAVIIHGDEAVVDFTGSAPQVRGGVNAVRAITLSAVFYVFRCLIEEDVPTNAGCMRPITLITPEGSVVNARFPAAVAGGNVETSQRIVDVILGALAQALPDRIPAASAGTMNNLTIGGLDPETGRRFAYYETTGGGMGGGPGGPGLSGVHTHMTNTMNTPIEALEHAYPFQVVRYGLRPGSGGAGRHPGGNGLVREIRTLARAEVSILSDRRLTRPYGLAGGRPGTPGRNRLLTDAGEKDLGGKATFSVQAGQVIRMETPGGGGWGVEEEVD